MQFFFFSHDQIKESSYFLSSLFTKFFRNNFFNKHNETNSHIIGRFRASNNLIFFLPYFRFIMLDNIFSEFINVKNMTL